jgi:flotillin
MMKTVPPLNDLFNMAGLNLPDYLKGTNPELPANVPPKGPAKAE